MRIGPDERYRRGHTGGSVLVRNPDGCRPRGRGTRRPPSCRAGRRAVVGDRSRLRSADGARAAPVPDRAADRASASGSTTSERAGVYYTALLVNVGCHTDAHEQAKWFGDDIALKATKYDHEPFSVARQSWPCAARSGGQPPLHRFRIGLEFAVSGRTDVDGMIAPARRARPIAGRAARPRRRVLRRARCGRTSGGTEAAGPASSRATRSRSRRGSSQLAEFVEVAHRHRRHRRGGRARRSASGHAVRSRAGRRLCRATRTKVFGRPRRGADLGRRDRRRAVARPWRCPTTQFDAALAAIADFVDLKSPYTLGHSRGVAELAAEAGALLGLPRRGGAHAAPRRARARVRPARRVERDLGQARPARRGRVGSGCGCTRTSPSGCCASRRRWRRSARSRSSTASASTGPAIRAGSRAMRSPRRRASSPPRTPTSRCASRARTGRRAHPPTRRPSCAREVAAGRLDGDAVDAVLACRRPPGAAPARLARRADGPRGRGAAVAGARASRTGRSRSSW